MALRREKPPKQQVSRSLTEWGVNYRNTAVKRRGSSTVFFRLIGIELQSSFWTRLLGYWKPFSSKLPGD